MNDPNQQSIRRNLFAGVVLAVGLVGGGLGWSTTAQLAGAVIASGQLVVESNIKKVQHPTGGVVGELRVREGDHVTAGDILLRLDETQTRASLAIITKGLDEFRARKAREEAERDGLDDINYPQELTERADEPDLARVMAGERRLFQIRCASREGMKAQLQERSNQIEEEITGLTAQVKSRERESHWIREELEGVRELWTKKLVQINRVTALERDNARLNGDRGSLIASIAQARGKITEIKLQILQIDQDLRTEVSKDLAELRSKISEFEERKISAEDQLKRIDLRAPQSGTVHQLDIHTIGGVVSPGQPVMFVVPDTDPLRLEAKVQPQDIDQIRLGQSAVLRLSAFNQRATPEIFGTVTFISPDVSTDQRTGAVYYLVRVAIPPSELARLKDLGLIPGMPVEAFFATGSRTVSSYVLRPLADQVNRAFRSE